MIVESVSKVAAWRGQDAVLPCIYQGYPHPRVKLVYRQFINPRLIKISIYLQQTLTIASGWAVVVVYDFLPVDKVESEQHPDAKSCRF